MISAISAAAMALSLISPVSAAAADSTPPDRITVDVVTVNGSGCRPGTAAVAVSPDNSAFTVTYSDFLAQAGQGTAATDFRKNCQLGLRINIPQGFTYGIASADYRGYANLKRNATGVQKASYYFQGHSATGSRTHTFYGPSDDNWQATDTTEVSEIVYQPCGEKRIFNVNAEVRVIAKADAPTSFMTMDSIDGGVNTIYHFSWKTCP
ncbi:protein of unknown function [Amycolatopsis xylanica]|uniref:DUF4360 domain-containing protein n=1 Tax=Amycolatopsis xylanica TaxID=589385 RepID=A0A1H3MVE9_9PSEU|nr:protein of unknown function [Amycolatopsis xylanica]